MTADPTENVPASLARQLAAPIFLFLMSACVTSLLASVFGSIAAWRSFYGAPFLEVQTAYQIGASTIFLLCTVASWKVLLHWRNRVDQGETLWFQQWTGIRVVSIMAGLMLITALIPAPKYVSAILPEAPPPLSANLFNLITKLGALVALPVLWFWWCDRPPRNRRTLTYVTLVWIFINVLPWSSRQLIHLDVHTYDPAVFSPESSGQLTVWSEEFGEYVGVWLLRLGTREFDMTFGQWLTSIVIAFFFVGISRLVYAVLRKSESQPILDKPG